ncbi:hypothetical protein KCP74_18360 [Salmonella enterica subsp. enterica]|nr:hypothetical protein KCP74_18360 [Salmonella enterica subsp. enterica]
MAYWRLLVGAYGLAGFGLLTRLIAASSGFARQLLALWLHQNCYPTPVRGVTSIFVTRIG